MIRQTIYKIVLILSLISTLTYSQTIGSIELYGNSVFSSNDYLRWIRLNKGTKIFEGISDSIKTRINGGLNSNGYFNGNIDIVISPIDSVSKKINITITENKPTTINKIAINYSETDSVFFTQRFAKLTNNSFNSQIVESVFNDVLTELENIGFPFASIKIESVYFYSDTLNNHFANLYLSIDKGIQSKIDRIEISGNTKTNERVITRAVGIRTGDKYDQRRIDEVPNRLNRLRFFEPVKNPTYYLNSKDEGILKIEVEEKQTNNFDGIIGYVPAATETEKGYLTGYVNIGLRNILGTGRNTAIRWQQENRFTQELELRYLEPWLFNFPFNIEMGLFQRKQDSTYIQRSVEGRIEYIFSEDISASFILNSSVTIPSERNIRMFTVYNSSSLTTGVNLKIDTRDDFYAPTSGLLLLNSYKYTLKKINGPTEYITPYTITNSGYQRLELDFNYFFQIFFGQIAAIGVHARELRGSDFELSDLYLLGGSSTLRGYREKQFQGNRILWSNLEYRYLLTRRSFAFLFFDSGYYLRNENMNVPEISGFKIGYGLGMNFETALGVLSVSFALAKGDSFSDGKIHFGIINEF